MIAKPKPSAAEGHILRNPVDPKSYFAMLCYKVSTRNQLASSLLRPQSV